MTYFKPPPPADDMAAASDAFVRAIKEEMGNGEIFSEWLCDRSTRDDHHVIAYYGNWDFFEPEVFQWIVSRPDCEAATALLIFWKAQPEYYLLIGRDRDAMNDSMNPNYVSDVVKRFDLTEYTRKRWVGEGYSNRNFGFEFHRDLWPNEFDELYQKFGSAVDDYLPVSMRTPIPGEQIETIRPRATITNDDLG